MSRFSNTRGFSLIEALVALAILSGVASTALVIAGSNLELSERATAQLRAILAAETLLNRVGLDVALKEQSLSGRTADGSEWILQILPYAEAGLQASGRSTLLQVQIRVDPRKRGLKVIGLKTLRLVGVPL